MASHGNWRCDWFITEEHGEPVKFCAECGKHDEMSAEEIAEWKSEHGVSA